MSPVRKCLFIIKICFFKTKQSTCKFCCRRQPFSPVFDDDILTDDVHVPVGGSLHLQLDQIHTVKCAASRDKHIGLDNPNYGTVPNESES